MGFGKGKQGKGISKQQKTWQTSLSKKNPAQRDLYLTKCLPWWRLLIRSTDLCVGIWVFRKKTILNFERHWLLIQHSKCFICPFIPMIPYCYLTEIPPLTYDWFTNALHIQTLNHNRFNMTLCKHCRSWIGVSSTKQIVCAPPKRQAPLVPHH